MTICSCISFKYDITKTNLS